MSVQQQKRESDAGRDQKGLAEGQGPSKQCAGVWTSHFVCFANKHSPSPGNVTQSRTDSQHSYNSGLSHNRGQVLKYPYHQMKFISNHL